MKACHYLAIPVFSLLLNLQAAKADFGAAEARGKSNEMTVFSAWCANIGNDCSVTFTPSSILVNGKDEVEYQRIRNFHYESVMQGCLWRCRYTFNILYKKSDGTDGVGKIIFAKESVALTFLQNLRNATGNKTWAGDPRCDRGEVFKDGICVPPSTAAELRTREIESSNSAEAIREHGRAIGAGLAVQGELQKQGLENIRVEQNTGVIVVPR